MTTTKTTAGLRRRAVLGMALAVIGLASAGEAAAGANFVDLTVVDRETGQPLRVWRHKGRSYTAGNPGARYSLRVTNHTGGRVLVVMSVDGVNILTGQTAGYGQSGYVLEPYQSYDVSGWRKSDTEVAAFSFASLSKSYAARTGRPGDVGVIGIAAFKERVVAPVAVAPAQESRAPAHDYADTVVGSSRARAAGAPAPAPPVAQARREEKLGTAHGAREWSMVTTVAFERATAYPQLIRQIEYDSYRNLVALGVIPQPTYSTRPPRPFPSSGGGYVPDPPGRP